MLTCHAILRATNGRATARLSRQVGTLTARGANPPVRERNEGERSPTLLCIPTKHIIHSGAIAFQLVRPLCAPDKELICPDSSLRPW
jgi:hypothetical protein